MSWVCKLCEEKNADIIVRCQCGNDINNSLKEPIKTYDKIAEHNRNIGSNSEPIGYILLIFGIVFLVMSILFNTTVDNVHNIGLLNQRIIYVISSSIIIIAGLLILLIGKK